MRFLRNLIALMGFLTAAVIPLAGDAAVPGAAVNMPLKAADFTGADGKVKKHYFLVGSRTADWRLLPEWEFKVEADGNAHLRGRLMWSSMIAFAVVDNYDDYINHRYRIYSQRQGDNDAFGTFIGSGDGTGGASGPLKGGEECQAVDYGDPVQVNPYLFHWHASAAPGRRYIADLFCWDGPKGEGFDDGAISRLNRITAETAPVYVGDLVLTLDDEGIPVNFAFKNVEDDEKTEAVYDKLMFTLVGSNIKNNNELVFDMKRFPSHNLNKDYTSYSDAWTKAWVSYDENGIPYTDARGQYLPQTLYQLDWMRIHPSYFQRDAEANNMPYTSRSMRLMSFNELDVNDEYYEYYKARMEAGTFGDARPGETGVNDKIYVFDGTGNPTVNPTRESGKWVPFVLADTRMKGSFKIWTGSGGGINYLGGYNDEAFANGKDDEGAYNYLWTPYNTGALVEGENPTNGFITGTDGKNTIRDHRIFKVAKNVRDVNLQLAEPTYFKRIILWYNPEKGFEDSYIEFIQQQYAPEIEAMRNAELDGLLYSWNLRVEGEDDPADKMVTEIEIQRYRINPATGLGVESGAVKTIVYPDGGKSVADIRADADSRTGVVDADFQAEGFDYVGTWYYSIKATFAELDADGKNKTATSNSNQVTLYAQSLPVVAKAAQRTETGDAGATLYSLDVTLDISLTEGAVNDKIYVDPDNPDTSYSAFDLAQGYIVYVPDYDGAMFGKAAEALNQADNTDARKFSYQVDRTVYARGKELKRTGWFIDIPFSDTEYTEGKNHAITLRWDNVLLGESTATADQTYPFRVHLWRNDGLASTDVAESLFARARFDATRTSAPMVIPGPSVSWQQAVVTEEYSGITPDAEMPMGVHGGTAYASPVSYGKVNQITAQATMAKPTDLTQSVLDRFDLGFFADLGDATTEISGNEASVTADHLPVATTELSGFTHHHAGRVFHGIAESNGSLHAAARMTYTRKADSRSAATPVVTADEPVITPELVAPAFEIGEGTTLNTRWNYLGEQIPENRYTVHGLAIDLGLTNCQEASSGLALWPGYHLTPACASDDLNTLVSALDGSPDNAPAGNGSACTFGVAREGAPSGSDWSTRWAQTFSIPLYVDYFAAGKGDTYLDGGAPQAIPDAKVSVAYHYPFLVRSSSTEPLMAARAAGDDTDADTPARFELVTLTVPVTQDLPLAGALVQTSLVSPQADADAPAVYYNLQGIPVAVPEPGSVYIVRRGENVSKIVKL